MIRAVLFDLDRTLLDRDTAFAAFASAQYDRFQPQLGPISKSAYVDRLVALDALGSVWKDVVYQRFVAELKIIAPSWKTLFDDFDRHIAEHYVAFPAVHETLTKLSAFYRLGLITNGRGEFQQRTLAALDIAHHFDAILISEIEGVRKPDPEIFHRALHRLDCTPAEAVYIGDHPDSDIRAAQAAGLRALWKRNPAFPAPPSADGSFDHLSELPALIARLA